MAASAILIAKAAGGGFAMQCACGTQTAAYPTPKAAKEAQRLHVRDDCPIGRR